MRTRGGDNGEPVIAISLPNEDWRHQVMTSIEPTYIELSDGEFRVTTRRPDAETTTRLAVECARIEARTFLHSPGDGLHYVPSPLEVLFIGGIWTPVRRQSYGAILAHADDLCRALGLDYGALYVAAYPDRMSLPITTQERADCARPATRADTEAVLSDLEKIHFGRLAKAIRQEIEKICYG